MGLIFLIRIKSPRQGKAEEPRPYLPAAAILWGLPLMLTLGHQKKPTGAVTSQPMRAKGTQGQSTKPARTEAQQRPQHWESRTEISAPETGAWL